MLINRREFLQQSAIREQGGEIKVQTPTELQYNGSAFGGNTSSSFGADKAVLSQRRENASTTTRWRKTSLSSAGLQRTVRAAAARHTSGSLVKRSSSVSTVSSWQNAQASRWADCGSPTSYGHFPRTARRGSRLERSPEAIYIFRVIRVVRFVPLYDGI